MSADAGMGEDQVMFTTPAALHVMGLPAGFLHPWHLEQQHHHLQAQPFVVV